MKIIAFSGKKQSGKTTAADFLADELFGQTEIINFASSLKAVVNGYWIEPVLGRQLNWDEWDEDGFKNKIHPCGLAYRQLLQKIGTDQWRSLWPDIWVENWKSILPDYPTIVLVADVRFPNEVKCIQDMGGHVIRFLRAPFPDDKHESETALDLMAICTLRHEAQSPIPGNGFDAIIDNRNMSIEQQNEAVWKLVKEKKWI